MDQVAAVIWDAAKCLCSCAEQEADYVFDLQENLQNLRGKWRNLEDMKKDVEANVEEAENSGDMRRSRQVHTWLHQIEAIQQEIINLQDQGAQEIQNKCLSKCCPKNCVQSYKLGKNVAKIIKNVDELTTEGRRFCQDFKIANRLPPKSIEIPLVETVGLDLMFDKVWNSIEAENIGVIGLYGMGGVGKTTLLKKINNEFGKRMLDFHAVMWVVVSKEPNLDTIMGTVRKLIGIGDNIWNDCSSQEEKAAKIYQVLKRKKFVLLLDDIWERLDLNMVGVPNPKETNFQSKVLFTTRSKDVCAKMQAQRIFKVEILTKKEAIDLFNSKVGEETLRSHPDIPNLAEEVAAECNGLPLALIVIGSAMAGVKSLEAWEHSKYNLTSSSWTASDLETKVFSILKFSYDKLPDETHKNCFLYCALYPEDYEIEIPNLIDKWIGEGFLGKDMKMRIRDMRGYGGSVIEKLKLSCLLETVEDDIFLCRSVKMHDVIRDMALWLVRDQDKNRKKVLLQGDALAMSQGDVKDWIKVERVSIIKYDLEWQLPVAAYCPNIITYFNIGNCTLIDTENIQYMRGLKVLELFVMRLAIPPEIGGLAFLEYLSLTASFGFSEFPLEFKKLRNLKFFSFCVFDGGFASIPLKVISRLQKLRVLRFFQPKRIWEERELLRELESLPNLEELWIQAKTEDSLNKLFESTKLQSCVWHLKLEDVDVRIKMPSLLASMSKMKHLQEVQLLQLNNVEDSFIVDTCCLSMLRCVTIYSCDSIRHLTWLQYAPLLQQLAISHCKSIEKVIKETTKDDNKNIENVDNIFSSLVKLNLKSLPRLKSIYKTALSFPSLRSITVEFCQNLKKLPFDSNSAKDKLREIRGNKSWWNNLEWQDPTIKEKFLAKFKSHY